MTQILRKADIRGVIPPVLSTFDDDEQIDLDRFASELEVMLRAGAELVVVGGGTGEGDTLTPDELASLVRVAAQTTGLKTIAGILATTERNAVHQAVLAKASGACALMLAQPMFTTPAVEGLVDYVEAVWEASQLPLIFYNHWALSADVVSVVARHHAVIAIKEGSIDTIGELTQTLGDEAVVLTGDDPINLAGYALGAVGSIAGINTALPGPSIAIYEAFTAGRLEEARRIASQVGPLARLTMNPVNFPARMKHTCGLQGRDVGKARRPYAPVGAAEHEQLREALREASLQAVEA